MWGHDNSRGSLLLVLTTHALQNKNFLTIFLFPRSYHLYPGIPFASCPNTKSHGSILLSLISTVTL